MSELRKKYRLTSEFLVSQLPMFQRVGMSAYKKDLTNIQALLAALHQPHQHFASLHIGGTNGKGSVTHLLSAVAQAAGLHTGLYVSPHYKDFRERIRLNGQYIDRRFVVEFVEQMRPVIDQIQPSFFEITVAMAFQYFAQRQADVAMVEVGMGGRLDSTNVLLPEVAIITNISYDHMQFLGNTLPLIAGEKAGIIKPGIPVVIGETQAETAPVFLQKARELGAPIYFADQVYQVTPLRQDATHTWYRVLREGQVRFAELAVNLHGPYQHLNLQTALMAIEVWQAHTGRTFPDSTLIHALAQLRPLTRFQGRWQLLRQHPQVIVDSAHNEGGLRYAMQALLQIPHRKLHIILGMVQDKESDLVLPLLPPQARYYFVKANVPRGLDARTLAQQAAAYGLSGRAYASVRLGMRAALRAAQPDDLVFVGGSIFVAAEVL